MSILNEDQSQEMILCKAFTLNESLTCLKSIHNFFSVGRNPKKTPKTHFPVHSNSLQSNSPKSIHSHFPIIKKYYLTLK
jgi:hypothetical protein